MPSFSRLIRFESLDDGQTYFADLGADTVELPATGSHVTAYASIDRLVVGEGGIAVTVGKLLAPLPYDGVPIYCVGLNYKTHAEEAKLPLPKCPPLWTKPAKALANPEEEICMNKYCASNFPDYEGEVVFVTSRECRDISVEEAESYILGYTAGNDLSCRVFQMPGNSGGQFFYAKAFDKFAPIGPTLLGPELFAGGKGLELVTRVNGQVMQKSEFVKEFIFSPTEILSHMSQGTTIPAGTAVMTGTPAGVGAFRSPRQFLEHNDLVEVEVSKVGILKNRIVFG